MKKATVIIVDDHKILREGLNYMLSELPSVEVIGEASNGKEFLDLLKVFKPDIVLMDINMPVMNGVEATKQALVQYPDLKVLVLSMFGDEEYYNAMIELGVKGFVLKESDYKEVKSAIENILDGKHYFSQDLLINVIKQKKETPFINFTPREKEVLNLICKGMSNSEISEKLHISIRTVEKHRSELLLKTDSNNAISLVLYAIKNQLVSIS